ncbi:MAG: penicillin-binding protein 1A [Steroidobacteraceae bacterium]
MPSRYKKTVLRWFLTTLILGVGGVGLLIAGAMQYLEPQVPDVAALRDVRLQIPLRIYSRDGKLLAQIGEQRRIPLAFAEYPQMTVNAFLAAEDDRFFEHNGVDYAGLIRAIAVNLSSGSKREGGGTITMQLARNMFLSPERSYRRKMLEIISAWRIEHAFSKQEILSLYLNKIFLGQRAYGVGAAAEVYFGKTVAELTLAETALLAGLPRAPSRENPVASAELAKQRRAYVLRRMRELGFINDSEREAADQAPVESRLHGVAVELDAPYIAEMARQELEQRYGQRIYTDNFSVYTTVDSRLQQAARRAVRLGLLEYDARHGYRGPVTTLTLQSGADEATWSKALGKYPSVGGLQAAIVLQTQGQEAQLFARGTGRFTIAFNNIKWARPGLEDGSVGKAPEQISDVLHRGDVVYVAQQTSGAWRLMQVPKAQSAFVALDADDGAIVALEGGFDFDASRFNRAVQAKRQPGSSFKPFLYSAALEHGFTPASIVNDSPVVVDDAGPEGSYRPQNTNKQFMGPLRIREALVRSRNLVSIRLISTLGTAYATDYIKRFGFSSEQLPQNLSLALGATQVAPLEMARGYAVFANGGMRVEPYLIDRVIGGMGELIYTADPLTACADCESPKNYTTVEAANATQRVAAEPDSAASAEQTIPAAAPDNESPSPASTSIKLAPRVVSSTNAFLMTDMMKDVIRRGTATRALVLNRRDIAGKTGTSNDLRDTWFVGFNGDLVGAAWVGFDQERPLGNGEEGGRTALPVWIYFMQEALRGSPEHTLSQPEGVVSVRIATDTGKATDRTGTGTTFEYFAQDHLPESGDETASESSTAGSGNDGLF